MRCILDFIFPTFCLHCEKKIHTAIFCEHCSQFLQLSTEEHFFIHLFEKNPVADLFMGYVKKHQFPEDIKTLCAYIILKIDQLNWEMPQKIEGNTPFTQKIAKGILPFIQRDKKKIFPSSELLIAEEKEVFTSSSLQVIFID